MCLALDFLNWIIIERSWDIFELGTYSLEILTHLGLPAEDALGLILISSRDFISMFSGKPLAPFSLGKSWVLLHKEQSIVIPLPSLENFSKHSRQNVCWHGSILGSLNISWQIEHWSSWSSWLLIEFELTMIDKSARDN